MMLNAVIPSSTSNAISTISTIRNYFRYPKDKKGQGTDQPGRCRNRKPLEVAAALLAISLNTVEAGQAHSSANKENRGNNDREAAGKLVHDNALDQQCGSHTKGNNVRNRT